jgi:hypothetical protein
MTVLSAVQLAAPWIGIAVPTVLFTGTDRTSVEMQAMVNECAKAIAEDFDWQRLRTLATITGDATTTDWSLPSDYSRMLKKAALWPSAMPTTPLQHIADSDEWLMLDVQSFQTVVQRWTIYGNQLHVKPAIASAATVKYFYISNKLVVATGGTAPTKTDFTLDTDSLFVDERLLQLSIIWRWKAKLGRPYAEDMANYQNAVDVVAGADKGSRFISIGRNRSGDVNIAFPWAVTP